MRGCGGVLTGKRSEYEMSCAGVTHPKRVNADQACQGRGDHRWGGSPVKDARRALGRSGQSSSEGDWVKLAVNTGARMYASDSGSISYGRRDREQYSVLATGQVL